MFLYIIGGIFFLIVLPSIIPRQNRIGYFACYISFILYEAIFFSILVIPFFMLKPRSHENARWGKVIASFEEKILGIKFEVKNAQLAKKEGNGIIVMNHLSMFDFLCGCKLYRYLGDLTFIARKEVLLCGPIGLTMWLAGIIFIDRGNQEVAIKSINKGVVNHINSSKSAKVVIFPEGTRNKTGKGLLPFKKGAFRLAIDNKLPIIPVVQSPYYFIKKNQSFTTGKKILSFLKPIETTNLTIKDIDTLMEITRTQMKQEYGELENYIKCLSNM